MMTREIYSVAVYDADRAYGGPEEGGWYYDAGDRIGTASRFFDTSEAATDYAARLNARLDREDRRQGRRVNISSVRSEGRREAIVFEDTAPPAHYPESRPSYC